jgi:hypothetical protein
MNLVQTHPITPETNLMLFWRLVLSTYMSHKVQTQHNSDVKEQNTLAKCKRVLYFDSGFGGIPYLLHAKQLHPQHQYVYLADNYFFSVW